MNAFMEDKGQMRRMWTCLSCGTHGIVVADNDAIAAQLAHDGHASGSPKCDNLRLHFDDEAEAQRLQLLGVQGLKVAAWSPDAVQGRTPPTQVHLLITVASLNARLMTRLKSRESVDDLIDELAHHRDLVWPVAPETKGYRWNIEIQRGQFVNDDGERCAFAARIDDLNVPVIYGETFNTVVNGLLDALDDQNDVPSDDEICPPLDRR